MFDIKLSKYINIVFPYGSRVYGTNSETSDYDYIIVSSIGYDPPKPNITYYSKKEFQDKINEHEISALECIFLPGEYYQEISKQFTFELDLPKLRSSISSKASNSWVKAKKKFTIEKDKDIYIGKKSLFHSLRIIDFGIQIARYKKIVDYSCTNDIWFEIRDNPSEDYNDYKTKYQPIYNSKMTEFRKLAPKE